MRIISFLYSILLLSAMSIAATAADLPQMVDLGRALFNDPALSVNGDQPCAFCHDPATGFSGPLADVNAAGGVYEGSVDGRFGNRRPPTAAYVSPGPVFHHVMEDGGVLFVGGAFLDGRATGGALGQPAADQAQGPFLNPLEMAMPHAACVVQRVCAPADPAAYPVPLAAVWGPEICAIDFPEGLAAACDDAEAEVAIADEAVAGKIDAAFAAIARSLAAFEASPEVDRFSSKFDRWTAGEAELTPQEALGAEVFAGKGLCAECHVMGPGPHGEPALLTDFTYDNLGVPKNPDLPWYVSPENPEGSDWVDLGLGAAMRLDPVYDTLAPLQDGKFKVPTLRNVAAGTDEGLARAYMHNGYF
ncbi:MAG: hypothetical protein JNK88_04005, partial [Mangrovicoccus sp.]|nr:hypothetical protein [Mangrovicoccus sp.]